MARTKTKAKERNRDADREDREEREERASRRERPKAKNDVYVVMLVITFFAILVGCVMLYLDISQYSGESPKKEVIPALTDLGGGKAGESKS